MPLEYIPENLDFDVTFESTRVADKKYVTVTSSVALWTR